VISDWILITNPAAGGSKKKAAKTLLSLAGKSGMDIFETTSLDQLNRTVKDAFQKGRRQFIFMGGDGSIHRAINSFSVSEIPFDQVKIAFLPCGTGNDWAQHHQLIIKANQFWRKIQEPSFFQVPLVDVLSLNDKNQRLCCNITGLGFDAFVVKQIALTGKNSKSIYMKKVVSSLTKYKSVKMRWVDDEGNHEEDIFSFHVGIGITAGGGMKIMPHAKQPPESLYVTVVKKADTTTYFKFIPRLLTGKLGDVPFIRQYQTHQIEIHGVDQQVGVECDGEWFGDTPIKIQMSSQSVSVLDTRQ